MSSSGKSDFISLLKQSRSPLIAGVLAAVVGLAAFTYVFRGTLGFGSLMIGPATQTTVENLRAFGKLYGYVRYFHPSDAASEVDWERFAVHGARKVKNASTPDELRETLEALFAPVAPTVQLYPTGEPPPTPASVLTPEDTTGLRLVAWQHKGYGFGESSMYRSVRLHRATRASSPDSEQESITQAVQVIDAAPYRGKEVKVRAAAKTDGTGAGRAHLWLFAGRSGQEQESASPMGDRPVTASAWTGREITRTVPAEARRIVFGGFLRGGGRAWFDDFELLVREEGEDAWTSVPVVNGGFEAGPPGEAPRGWETGDASLESASTTAQTARGGERSLRLGSPAPIAEPAVSPEGGRALFEARPAPGEVVNKTLGRGLSAQIPLALYSRDGQTPRPDEAPSPRALKSALENLQIDRLTAADEALRLADVIMAWNVFQHFYPYFDVVEVDWDAVLTRTLRRALSDQSAETFLRTLQRMVVQLDDGHGKVIHPAGKSRTARPFRIDRIGGEVVVVDVVESVGLSREACAKRGDVVVSIGGVGVEEELQAIKQYISGSPQFRELIALHRFGQGEPGTFARTVLRRDGRRVKCRVYRGLNDELIQEERPYPIQQLRRGIYYVDLTRVEWTAIERRLDAIARAGGVIFDVRGVPRHKEILRHLSDRTLRSARWQVPQIIYPDHERVAGYDTTGRWRLTPRAPRLTGEIVFLTDARAISKAESVMGIVEHYALGAIVGQPTAGTNGNVNPFTLPGGYEVSWTGMRVVKHDGSQHHLVGIQPTAPVEHTREGVREGRDEYIETALEVIK